MASDPPEINEATSPQLNQLFTPQTVRARLAVRDWQETVRAVGRLLVESGSVTPGYVQAMEDALRELGPYAVLAPGIVLLHARPENGVLKPCIALATLAAPVSFGHSQNDPVDIALALGATDKTSHILALRQLAGLLADAAALARLRAAPDDAALLAVVQAWGSHP